MFKTEISDLLGTELPIVGGTMMDLSTPPFVTAISEAGALGVLPSAMYKEYDAFRDALKTIKDGTDKPFAVNINLFPIMEKLDNFRYLEVLAEEGVKIVETSGFAPPVDLMARIKDLGLIWLHKCVGVRYAIKAEKLGANAVEVVGFENGGATGTLNIATLILVPSTVDAVSVPVIGGGGVVDGRTLLAVLSLGAKGAIVGTALMLSEECPMHPDLKKALLKATELDTGIIMKSVGFAHRVWMNEPAKKVAEIEVKGGGINEIYPYVSGEAARRMYETGDVTAGSVSCSQGIGLINEIKPVKDVLADMMDQAKTIYAGLKL
ncbi:MAG: nitronate monooxygenase family protein [Pseudomonadota bacterium]